MNQPHLSIVSHGMGIANAAQLLDLSIKSRREFLLKSYPGLYTVQ
jgi:hypothetical protein